MALFLVQHGISLPKDQDPKKGLSTDGIEQSNLIAGVAKNYQIPVRKIVHSGKTRANQTAQIFQTTLELDTPMEAIQGIAPLDDVAVFARKIDAFENTMVVGHLPFMQRLVSFLICGDSDNLVIKFQNSGIVCLEHERDSWFIKWALNPKIS